MIENQNELAAASSHEIARVIACHSLELNCIEMDDCYSKPLALLRLAGYNYRPAGLFALPLALTALVLHAFLKIREREADDIRLLLMSDAGLNWAGAVSLWAR